MERGGAILRISQCACALKTLKVSLRLGGLSFQAEEAG